MLLLGKEQLQSKVIEGLQLFPDHENPKQWWYLSGPVRLAERDNKSQFTLIKYNKNAKEQGAQGGGFVTFEVNVGLSENVQKEIREEIEREKGIENIQLSSVPFNKGSVKCVALDVDSENILGASSPTLYGENSAIFSLSLNETETAIFEQSFDQGGQPIGVYYELEFTAMNPSLDVRLNADLSRIYKEFQATVGYEGPVPKTSSRIDTSLEAGFQRLVQTGAIKMEVITFVDNEDVKRQRDEALRLFMDVLLKEWFEPTLALPKVTDEDDKEDFVIDKPTEEQTSESTNGSKEVEKDSEEKDSQEDGVGEDAKDIADAAKAISKPFIPQITLKLRYVDQRELKKLSYRFNGSQTTLRTYYPQGFFSRLLGEIDKGTGLITADVNDLFFETLNISAEAPRVAYEKYGLQSVHFAAKYPERQVESLVFDKSDKTAKSISFPINKNLDLNYSCQLQYNFLPDSGWDGELMTYEVPWQETEDRTQVLIPHKHIGFLDINASLERNFEWGNIQEVQLHLSYQSPTSDWSKDIILRFTPDSETEQHWKLRLNDPAANAEYTYHLEYFLADGSSKTTEKRNTYVAGITVPDLTQGELSVRLTPLLDPAIDKRVYVDIKYTDPGNNFAWKKTIEVTAESKKDVDLQIPLMDTAVDEFEYTLTFVRVDNKIYKKPFPKAKYEQILLKSESTSKLTIEVMPEEIDWDAVRLVSVELLYQDQQNDIQEVVSQTFRKYDQPFEWTIEIADKSLTRYDWQAIFYMRDSSLGDGGKVNYPAQPDTWKTETDKILLLDKYQPKAKQLKVEISAEDIDWEEVKKVKVWLRYEDEDNDIDERDTITLDEDQDSFGWQVKLADATHTEYRWKAKYYLTNNKSERIRWETDTATDISLDDALADLLD